MRTGNPVLNSRAFENFGLQPRDLAAENAPVTTMTVTGTANRTMFLLALAFCSACFTWSQTFNAVAAAPEPASAATALNVLPGHKHLMRSLLKQAQVQQCHGSLVD